MNLDKRQQLLAIVAIVAVGCFLADKIIFTPLTNNWKARSAQISRLKESVRDGTETLKRENALREQWDRMRTNTLSSAKPEAESQMLKAFERWSQSGGVAVSSIRPQWKEAEDDYKTLECRADVTGSLPSIAHFLYQIEHDSMGVKVDTLELTARDNEGKQLALVVQVSGLLLNPPKKKS
jgi:Tfp pilus assembly protein PilO